MADARLQDNSHLQEAIQQPIENEEAQQESKSLIQDERPSRFKFRKMPIFTSVAAVFAITVLVGFMFMNNNDASQKI